jgi:hypothetical protein
MFAQTHSSIVRDLRISLLQERILPFIAPRGWLVVVFCMLDLLLFERRVCE